MPWHYLLADKLNRWCSWSTHCWYPLSWLHDWWFPGSGNEFFRMLQPISTCLTPWDSPFGQFLRFMWSHTRKPWWSLTWFRTVFLFWVILAKTHWQPRTSSDSFAARLPDFWRRRSYNQWTCHSWFFRSCWTASTNNSQSRSSAGLTQRSNWGKCCCLQEPSQFPSHSAASSFLTEFSELCGRSSTHCTS